ncbi:MAG TPA: kynureninase [Gammaproteobacteria bacterium]|nr:kynureninase [Gammaproteobacteria bacterium]
MAKAKFSAGLAGARALDGDDELAVLRREFELPLERGRTLIYLCGHSLGLMPRGARRAVETELDRWAALGVDGHFPDARPARGRARPLRDGHEGWLDYHVQFTPMLADLVGAGRDEVVAMNTLTVNLHLMLATFFRPTAQRFKILIERDAFSSDRYAVESQLRWHGLDPRTALLELGLSDGSFELDREGYEALLAEQGESIALVLLPGVQYLTGERLDLAAYAAAAQRYGCRVGFDLAHAVGNVPLAIHDSGADFAVWCSYKYLNAGPGAVAGCFVHRRHGAADAGRDARGRATQGAVAENLPRLAGWWGHDRARRFLMEPKFTPLSGAEGWQISNPPILSLAPLKASLALFEQAGLKRLRRKSLGLTRYLEWLLDRELGGRARLLTPADPERRGCHIALQFAPAPADPSAFVARLRAAGIVADWRKENVLRLAPVPLYNRYRDVYGAVQALKRTLDE